MPTPTESSITPAHAQALEALRETREALRAIMDRAPVHGTDQVTGETFYDMAAPALAHADHVLAVQAKEMT